MSTSTTTTIDNIVSPLEIEGRPVFDLYRDVPEADWERAAAMIPEPVEGFIDREIFGQSGMQHLIDAIVLNENVMVTGDAGSGKSTLFEALAGELQVPLNRVDCSPTMSWPDLMGRSTVAGLMTDTDDVQGYRMNDTMFAFTIPSIVLFDEINRMDPAADTETMAVTSEARVVSVPESDMPRFRAKTLLFGATSNPDTYAGTFQVDEAVSRRYIKLPWGYDRDTEEQLIGSPTLINVAWAIRGHANIRTILPTSTLLRFQKRVRYQGHAEAALGLLLEDFSGLEREVIETTLDGRMPIIVDELTS